MLNALRLVEGYSSARGVLVVALLGFTACLFEGSRGLPPGVDTRLTLLHTRDLHSRLLPFELVPDAADVALGLATAHAPFGGAARLGYVVERERRRSERTLYLDSGDSFEGAPIF